MTGKKGIKVEHVRGSGPGGQHRNKRMTGIRIEDLATGTVVMATERRSQWQNLAAAKERLEDRLRKMRTRKKVRIATKKGKAAQEKRLKSKKMHARKLSERRWRGE